MREARKRPTISSELARIIVANLGQENFLTSYWGSLADKKLTIEEFVAEKSAVEDILKGLKIEILYKYQEEIENSDELKDEMSILINACGNHFNEHIVEHDAFHRILIKKLRERKRYNFKDAIAWFLTHDSKLPIYSKFARKGKDYLPFCLTTNQWIQLNRPFIARTKNESEYEESLLNLITQPFLRSIIPQHPLQNAYEKVLGRLSRYKNMSPELASEITSDTHFMLSIGGIKESNNSYETVEKAVDEQIAKHNRELRKELEKLKSNFRLESSTSRTTIKNLEKKVKILDEIISKTNEEKNEIEAKKKEIISDSSKEISEHKNKIRHKIEGQIEDYISSQLKKWQNKIWWNLVWVIPFTVVCLWIILFPSTISQLEGDTVTIRIVIGIFFLIFDGLFLYLIRSRYWDESNKKVKKDNIPIPPNLKQEMQKLN